MSDQTTHKHCRPCDRTLPLDAFTRNRRYPDQRAKQCRGCLNARRRERKAVQREIEAMIARLEAHAAAERAEALASYTGPEKREQHTGFSLHLSRKELR